MNFNIVSTNLWKYHYVHFLAGTGLTMAALYALRIEMGMECDVKALFFRSDTL